MKHKERMMAIIKEECDKAGIDVDTLASRNYVIRGNMKLGGNVYMRIAGRSQAFLSFVQQADILGIGPDVIDRRVELL